MKKNFLSAALLALCFLMGTSLASAAACTTGENLILGDSPGLTATPSPDNVCTVGSLSFQNFSYLLDAGAFTTMPASVTVVTGSTLGSSDQLVFDPNIASSSDLELEFQVAGGVTGVSLSVPGLAGAGFVNEIVCTVFFTPGSGCMSADELAVLNVTSTAVTATAEPGCVGCMTSTANSTASVSFPAESEVWIFKDINAGTAPYSEVSQTYSTPEPMSLSLLGTGLLGLGLLRRRLKK